MVTVTIHSSLLLFLLSSYQSSLHSSHQCSRSRLSFHQQQRRSPQQLTTSSSIFINIGKPATIFFLSHHQQLTASSSSTAAGDIALLFSLHHQWLPLHRKLLPCIFSLHVIAHDVIPCVGLQNVKL